MTNKTSAMRYARALLDVAIAEQADLDRIEQDLVGVAGLLTQYPALADALLNPVVPVPRKRAAVAELTALSQLTPMVGKLIAMLADRDRLVLVADLPAAYRDRLLAHRNVIRAEITTTVPLSEERAKGVEASLATRHRPDRVADDEGGSVDHRRRRRAHRQHGVRRQHHTATAENQTAAGRGRVSASQRVTSREKVAAGRT